VLPGIQATFGFQLIAVFSWRFSELAPLLQYLHLAAVMLVVVAIALIMMPAAYHRIAEREVVSDRFIDLSSNLIASAMLPFMTAVAIDAYVIAYVVTNSPAISAVLGFFSLALLSWCWFVFPYKSRDPKRFIGDRRTP
jgi:Family of unknown function (DUF6328)